ncbi:MAG: methyltransferase domain-containing protein [Parcubacteria group bacterium]|nr:methyltransferase domain-containing protein [Parcubacteria group bacterium]
MSSLVAFPVMILLLLLIPLIRGAPFIFTHRKTVATMLQLAGVKPGERVADLGAGDGRLVIAFAQAGAEAHGYEIIPILVWLARRNIRKAGLTGRAFVDLRNFFHEDLSSFQIVTVFGMAHLMPKLETKLLNELPPGARILSHAFAFPTWQPIRKEGGVFLYEKQSSTPTDGGVLAHKE